MMHSECCSEEFTTCGEGGWISERHLSIPDLPPLLILPENASRKEVLAILAAKLDEKETQSLIS
jgi:hypothetical protein